MQITEVVLIGTSAFIVNAKEDCSLELFCAEFVERNACIGLYAKGSL